MSSSVNFTILLAATDREQSVISELREIAQHGLLRRFAVLEPDFTTTVIEQAEIVYSGELRNYLAGLELERVRLIRVSLDGGPISREHSAFCASLRNDMGEYIESLELGTLTVPAAGQRIDPDAFSAFWNFNVIVEPLDGAGQSGFLPVATSVDKQQTIAAAAVALIGGLWSWLDEAPFDCESTAADGLNARVSLVRLATRVVDAGDITARSVGWALAPGAQLPAPIGFVKHGDQQAYVNSLVGEIAPLTSGSPLGLTYRPPDPFEAPSPRKMGIWAAIRFFFKALWEELRGMPGQWIRDKVSALKNRLEAAVQTGTFGADSEISVAIGSPSTLEEATNVVRKLGKLESMAGSELGPPPVSAGTWGALTTLVHGSADGTPFPSALEGLQPKWEGTGAVLTDLSVLAARDLEGFQVSDDEASGLGGFAAGGFVIAPYDALLSRVVSDLSEVQSVASPVVVESKKLLPPAVAGTGPVSDSNEEIAGGLEVDLDAAQVDPDSLTHDSDGEAASVAEDRAPFSALERLRERHTAWRAERESTLLWQVSERMLLSQDLAAKDLEGTQAELELLVEELEAAQSEADTASKRFVKRAVMWLGATILLVALTVVGFFLLSLALAAVVGMVALLLGLGGITRTIQLARHRVQARFRIQHLLKRDQYLIEKRAHAAKELHRLIVMYGEYQDWSEVLASSVHQPWGEINMQSVSPWRTGTGAFSFVCGEPKISDEGMIQATLATAQRIAKRGWLRDAYTQRRTDWVKWYANVTGNMAGTDDEPEDDNRMGRAPVTVLPAEGGRPSTRIYSPRVHFRQNYVAAFRVSGFRDEFLNGLRAAASDDTANVMIGEVLCDSEGLRGRSVRDFTAPLVEGERVPSFGPQLTAVAKADDSISVASIIGITDSDGLEIPEGRTLMKVQPIGHRALVAAFRLDVSSPIDPLSTIFVSRASTHQDEANEADDGEESYV